MIQSNEQFMVELSRTQLLTWVSTVTSTPITKIQQLGTGSIYCILLDLIYSHTKIVPLSKVNLKAKNEYEYINNFKILQQCFNKLQIMKSIEVEKLVKCKYQDNLEFLQWFKKMYDQSGKSIGVGQGNSGIGSHNVSIIENQMHLIIGQRNQKNQKNQKNQRNQKQNKRPSSISSRTMIYSNSVKENTLNESTTYTQGQNNNLQNISLGHKKKPSSINLSDKNKKCNKNTDFASMFYNILKPDNEQDQNQIGEAMRALKSQTFHQINEQFEQELLSKSEPISLQSFFKNITAVQMQSQVIKQHVQQKKLYLKKLKEIEHLLQIWNMQKSSQELTSQIRKIIFTQPPNIADDTWGIDQTGEIVFYQNRDAATEKINLQNNQSNNKIDNTAQINA